MRRGPRLRISETTLRRIDWFTRIHSDARVSNLLVPFPQRLIIRLWIG
jgi:hypothetical protein